MDLLDYWRRKLSLRKIAVYIKSLLKKPGRSSLLQALDESSEWGPESYLLARISDAFEASNFMYMQVNSSEEGKTMLEVPKPIRRPGEPEPEYEEKPKYEFASGDEVAGFFSRMSSL